MISLAETCMKKMFPPMQTLISEYCFSNAFCFQDDHRFTGSKLDGLSYLKGQDADKKFLMPLFIPKEENLASIKKQLETHNMLYPIDEKWVSVFEKDNGFIINSFDKNWDYLFATERLADMSGGKLSKKRNLISQFHKLHPNNSVQELTKENYKDGIAILEQWAKEVAANKEETDFLACASGVEHFEILELKGLVLYVDNKPIGFALGEIANDSYILHFAKANIHYKGAYQYLFKATAQMFHETTWINFEQDLGLPQLRQMKKSYYPDKMVKKYTITLSSS